MAEGAPGISSGKGGGFRSKMHGLKEKLRESHVSVEDQHASDIKVQAVHLKNKIGKFGNLFNPNHRHDEKDEKETDAKRTRIAECHRFGSFAPERAGNNIKWYVDGRNYYWVSWVPSPCAVYKILIRSRLSRKLSNVRKKLFTLPIGGYLQNWYERPVFQVQLSSH